MIFYITALRIIVGLLVDHGMYGAAAAFSLSTVLFFINDMVKKL